MHHIINAKTIAQVCSYKSNECYLCASRSGRALENRVDMACFIIRVFVSRDGETGELGAKIEQVTA